MHELEYFTGVEEYSFKNSMGFKIDVISFRA